MKFCDKCGFEMDEWETGWPGREGGTICQDCWETESSEDWWDACAALQIALDLEEM